MSDNKEHAYDALLPLTPAASTAAVAEHLPWGMPSALSAGSGEEFLVQDEYVTCYDDDLRVPLWVAYRLTAQDLVVQRDRKECFRNDPRLDGVNAAFCADYEEKIFDRGHMVPNSDMERSEAAMINTYILSNIAPQHDKFNRGIWNRLEGYVRAWAKKRGDVYVVTGAVFDRDGNGKRDADSQAARMITGRVAVPTHFFKIIVHQWPNGFIETLAILLPHVDASPKGPKADHYLASHLVSIDAIEARASVDYFPALPDMQEGTVEALVAAALWPRK
ncbi:MAG: DNA/RNA non-specific endonuclease [Candidatus Hydrogenedentes bacterium]|nr:DNA/RNA non-specific endonuclease [Candidatus Hydrogenedentota bacterium]